MEKNKILFLINALLFAAAMCGVILRIVGIIKFWWIVVLLDSIFIIYNTTKSLLEWKYGVV